MNEVCEWKKFIRILLPEWMWIVVLVILLSGQGTLVLALANDGDGDMTKLDENVANESSGRGIVDRLEKVKAKWKGELFWTQAASTLAKLENLESKKSLTASSPVVVSSTPTTYPEGTPPPSFRNINMKTNKKKSKGSSKPKGGKNSNSTLTITSINVKSRPKVKTTRAPQILPRTTLTAEIPGQEYYLEYEHDRDAPVLNENGIGIDSFLENEDEESPIMLTNEYNDPSPRYNLTTTRQPTIRSTHKSKTTKKSHRLKSKPTRRSKPKPMRNGTLTTTRRPSGSGSTKVTKVPQSNNLDRTTITADYNSDYYLEYTSDAESTSTQKNTTAGNNDTVKIQFFPKTPVNLLYLLQAMASNMQPIKLHSPLGGEAPSLPVRVPVKVNSPNSPFLFSFDMDSFMTRLAISFFYSSMAVAPMIYMLIGGLGQLSGLSIVPFGAGRRKRRRSLDLDDKSLVDVVDKNEGFNKFLNNLGLELEDVREPDTTEKN